MKERRFYGRKKFLNCCAFHLYNFFFIMELRMAYMVFPWRVAYMVFLGVRPWNLAQWYFLLGMCAGLGSIVFVYFAAYDVIGRKSIGNILWAVPVYPSLWRLLPGKSQASILPWALVSPTCQNILNVTKHFKLCNLNMSCQSNTFA